MNFNELPFSRPVLEGIKEAGFVSCTEVQSKVLPVSLEGKDLMVQSKTGSGKTAVYLLTILEAFARAKEAGKPTPKSLIVAPTRELAVQIEADAKVLSSHMDITVGAFYGGVGYDKQNKLLSEGCDVFVCTPGRILDHQKSHKVDFRQFDSFIVDEADRLFDMGFFPDINKMFSLLRDKEKRQTMLFSATLGLQVQNIAWKFMNEPVEIAVQPEEITVNKITQQLYHVSKDEKFDLFLRVLTKINPSSCLVFTNTKARATEVAKRLTANGYRTKFLMGDLPQKKRLSTIDEMKEGKLNFLCATDVAARGLQIDDLELVVNYDLPDDYENYVHRIGRTARAGKSGIAISFADEEYVYNLEAIEDFIKMKIPVIWPQPGDLPEVEDKSRGMKFHNPNGNRGRNNRGGSSRRRDDRRGGGRNNRKPDRNRSSNGGRKRDDRKRDDRKRDDRKRDDRPSSRKRNNARNGKDVRRNEKQVEAPKRSRSSYKNMQKMTLEQRLNYYKKEYRDEKQAPAAEKAVKKSAAPAAVKKPAKKKAEAPKKKRSFLSRLFGKRG